MRYRRQLLGSITTLGQKREEGRPNWGEEILCDCLRGFRVQGRGYQNAANARRGVGPGSRLASNGALAPFQELDRRGTG